MRMTARRMTVRRRETAMVTATGRGGVGHAQGALHRCGGVVRVGDARLVLVSARSVDGSYVVAG
jgi:CRISPR/Cas system CMR subunit Cmr4 (Cas7 group RAMP superfamily)